LKMAPQITSFLTLGLNNFLGRQLNFTLSGKPQCNKKVNLLFVIGIGKSNVFNCGSRNEVSYTCLWSQNISLSTLYFQSLRVNYICVTVNDCCVVLIIVTW
jgi:hypothetical protein